MPEKKQLTDELVLMEEKLTPFHYQLVTRVYSKINKIKFSPVELSILLNVNKEIETSAKALIKSLSLI